MNLWKHKLNVANSTLVIKQPAAPQPKYDNTVLSTKANYPLMKFIHHICLRLDEDRNMRWFTDKTTCAKTSAQDLLRSV